MRILAFLSAMLLVLATAACASDDNDDNGGNAGSGGSGGSHEPGTGGTGGSHEPGTGGTGGSDEGSADLDEARRAFCEVLATCADESFSVEVCAEAYASDWSFATAEEYAACGACLSEATCAEWEDENVCFSACAFGIRVSVTGTGFEEYEGKTFQLYLLDFTDISWRFYTWGRVENGGFQADLVYGAPGHDLEVFWVVSGDDRLTCEVPPDMAASASLGMPTADTTLTIRPVEEPDAEVCELVNALWD